MRTAALLALIPAVLATFGGHEHEYGGGRDRGNCKTWTKTEWATTKVTVAVPDVTSTRWVYGDCLETKVNTFTKVKTVRGDKTVYATITPTAYETAAPTETVTRYAKAETTTVCYNGKRDSLPDELSNAERLRRHLPLRSPVERHYGGGHGGPRASCTPTTTTVSGTKTRTIERAQTRFATQTYCSTVTKDVRETVTSTVVNTVTKKVTADETVTITKPARSAATAVVTPTSTLFRDCNYGKGGNGGYGNGNGNGNGHNGGGYGGGYGGYGGY